MASGVPRTASRVARLARTQPLGAARPFAARFYATAPDPPEPQPEPKVVETAADSRPRWSFTPPLTQAPFSLSRPKDPRRSVWESNSDPAVLDRFYEKFLGPQGAEMLPEELKWLAVTHKSFDQGRRGFNDRLAYFGGFSPFTPTPFSLYHGLPSQDGEMRVCVGEVERNEGLGVECCIRTCMVADTLTGRQAVALELTKDIISSTPMTPEADPHGREPFRHPQLDGVNNLAQTQPRDVVAIEKTHKLALEIGLLKVLRWKPRLVRLSFWGGKSPSLPMILPRPPIGCA